MTYAESKAHEAIDGARRCEFATGGMHSEACRAAARAIEAALAHERERCARVTEDFNFIKAREHEWSRYIATRIRALGPEELP